MKYSLNIACVNVFHQVLELFVLVRYNAYECEIVVTLSGQKSTGLNRGDDKELVKALRPGLYTSVIFPDSLGSTA